MTHAPGPTPPTLSTNAATPPKVRARPSGWWYVLVPVLFFGGLAYGILGGIEEGMSVVKSFSTLGADGRGSIELDEGDQATVMAVWDDGRSTDGITRPPASVSVHGPDDADVAFDPAGSSRSTYSINSTSGIDLGTFTADSPGTYEVQVTFDTGAGSAAVPSAAVGRLDIAGIASRVFRPIGWGVAAAIGLWILLAVLRGRSKRRQRAEPQYVGQAPVTTASSSGTTGSSGPFV